MNSIQLSGVASLFVAGLSLLGVSRMLSAIAGERGASQDVLRFTALTLISLGLLGACCLATGAMGFISWLIVLGIWGRVAMHYRDAQKRNLFSAIAIAADHQMPLAPMALAFANEQEGAFGHRVRHFANTLCQGSDLQESIRRCRGVLPKEARLAAAVGLDSGDLASAFRVTSYNSVFDRALLRPVMTRLLYVFPVLLFFLWFMKVKVQPSWIKICEDFGFVPPTVASTIGMLTTPGNTSTPSTTSFGVEFQVGNGPSRMFTFGGFSDIAWLCTVISAVFFVLAIYAYLQYRGTLLPRLPGWKRIVNWVDMAVVLRIVALAARLDRPLPGMVAAIARFHPKRSMRRRMRRVEREMNDGRAWLRSFERQRLLGSTDAAVLAAAERTGNLSWALVEMAESFERRAAYRLKALAQVIFPALFLPVGVVAAVSVAQYMIPFFALIQNLS